MGLTISSQNNQVLLRLRGPPEMVSGSFLRKRDHSSAEEGRPSLFGFWLSSSLEELFKVQEEFLLIN